MTVAVVCVGLAGLIALLIWTQPGIPWTANTADAQNFWISFWAGLYSGLIYSLFTGLVVGLAVWLVQRSAESRRLRNEAARDFVMLRRRLRHALAMPNPLTITSASGSALPSAVAIVALLADYPIDQLRPYIQGQRALFDLLARLDQAHSDFIATANTLDFWLGQAIRVHNASKGIIAVNDGTDRGFFIGRIHGQAPAALLPWLDVDTGALPRFEQSFAVVSADARVTAAVTPYMEKRTSVASILEDLRRLIGHRSDLRPRSDQWSRE